MEAPAELITSIAALVAAAAWPTVAAVFLVANRRRIGRAMDRFPDLVSRVKSFKLPGFEAELDRAAQMIERRPDSVENIGIDEIRTAAHIEARAGDVDRGILFGQVQALSHEYEITRRVMRAGRERTRTMTRIFLKMRMLGPSVVFMLDDLKGSERAGDRLFAIAIMQVDDTSADIPWLEERFKLERPFAFFHAANALRILADLPEQRVAHEAREAARRALDVVRSFSAGTPDRETIRLLEDAAAEAPERR